MERADTKNVVSFWPLIYLFIFCVLGRGFGLFGFWSRIRKKKTWVRVSFLLLNSLRSSWFLEFRCRPNIHSLSYFIRLLSLSLSLYTKKFHNSIPIPNFMGFQSSTTSYHPSPPCPSLRKHRFHFAFFQNLSPFSLSINSTTRSSSSGSSYTNAFNLTLNLNRPNNFLFSQNSPKLSRKSMIRSSSQEIPSISSSNNRNVIIFRSLITVSLAVANRMLYKLALVPMKQYPFFLAQFTTFGSVPFIFLYFCHLYICVCACACAVNVYYSG